MNVRKSSNNLSYAPTDVRGFAILPDCLLVRYIIHVLYPQKSAETGAVHNLIFYLMVVTPA